MKDRKEMSEQAKQRRDANHNDNLNRLHGSRWRGTYFENGVGNPGSYWLKARFSDPVTRAYAEHILALNRGKRW